MNRLWSNRIGENWVWKSVLVKAEGFFSFPVFQKIDPMKQIEDFSVQHPSREQFASVSQDIDTKSQTGGNEKKDCEIE